jgi:transcriptional regulator with XRE-family HTH domain
MNRTSPALPEILRGVRRARRMSQLELSMRVGVSQRHMSFVASGRSNPSRELLLAWLQELDAPLAVRNAAMTQAGYAPVFSAASLNDPSLAQANEAMSQLLQAHDPMPALLIDADWNLLRMNAGAGWLAVTLMPWIAGVPPGEAMNLLDLLTRPDDFTRHMFAADDATRDVIRSQVA